MFQALLSFQSNSNLSAPKDAPDTPQLLSILLPTGSLKRPSNFPQDFAAPKWHSVRFDWGFICYSLLGLDF
jgi:hypothetical protein